MNVPAGHCIIATSENKTISRVRKNVANSWTAVGRTSLAGTFLISVVDAESDYTMYFYMFACSLRSVSRGKIRLKM